MLCVLFRNATCLIRIISPAYSVWTKTGVAGAQRGDCVHTKTSGEIHEALACALEMYIYLHVHVCVGRMAEVNQYDMVWISRTERCNIPYY